MWCHVASASRREAGVVKRMLPGWGGARGAPKKRQWHLARLLTHNVIELGLQQRT